MAWADLASKGAAAVADDGGAGRDLTGTDMKLLMRAGRDGNMDSFAPGTPDYEARYADERAGYEKRHGYGQMAGALGLAAPFVLGAGLGIGSGAAAGGGSMMPAAVPAVDPTFGGALTQISPGVYSASGAAAGGAAAGALGASGAEAIGLPAASPAPAPLPTPSPVASAAAPTAASAPAGAAPAAAEMSFTDSLIKQMKDNALGLGLMGAGTVASLSAGQPQMPNQGAIQGMGADAAAVSKQLIAQYQSGNLAPGQKAGLDQLTQNTKNQLRQYFASIGQADSTAAAQAMAQVDSTALEMKQQMLDTALQQGLSAIGVAQGPLNSIAQYQLGQDAQLKQAFGNFAGGVGMLMGRNSGTPTPPKSSAQTPQPVSSIQQPAPA